MHGSAATTRGRLLARMVALVVVGVLGLSMANIASPASGAIEVGSLAVVSGTATGTISGFEAGGSVTVNGATFVADASGAITLVAAPLGGSNELQIGFSDSLGAGHLATAVLRDATTGLPLSPTQLLDAIPDQTTPLTISFETADETTTGGGGPTTSGTTTGGTSTGSATTDGTTTSTGGTSTSGTTTGGTSRGGIVADQQPLPRGAISISARSVALPSRLVIKQVAFTPRVVRARGQLVVARYRIADSRGFYVRDAAVWMRGTPSTLITHVREKRSDASGWVTFTFRTTKVLRLKKGGRLTIFVRAHTPGEPPLGGTSTRRLVSLRISTPR